MINKPRALLEPLQHRGGLHIKVIIPNLENAKALVRQVPGRKWSKTHTCWYVPYTPEAYRQLKDLFDLSVEPAPPATTQGQPAFPEAAGNPPPQPPAETVRPEQENRQQLHQLPSTEYLRTKPSLPKHKTIENFPDHYQPKKWDNDLPRPNHVQKLDRLAGFTVVTAPPEKSAERLKNDAEATPVISEIRGNGQIRKVVTGNTVIVCSGGPGWLHVFVPYDRRAWIDHVKRIPGRAYSYDDTCWKVPLSRESIRELKGYFRESLVLTFDLPAEMPDKWANPWQAKQRNTPAFQPNETQRLAVTALEERLILESKLPRTIKTYKNYLTGLLAHYPAAKPSRITLKQIQDYIIFKRKESKLSNSAVNGLISALNAFYGRLLGQTDKVQALERPPKKRTLPNVLSTEEVQRLLTATENIKHKCMLLLIYSAGLRKGELLRLRARDLNEARQCLFVKHGKGGKDRFSFYTPTAAKYVSEYLREYKPRYWLFEGQTGDQYSETSLQVIFDRARQRSGVNPHITIHGLRHSFATHLVEKNVPLHVIKQLLGHEDIKTTEIYLHISNKYMTEIKSPLEGMEI